MPPFGTLLLVFSGLLMRAISHTGFLNRVAGFLTTWLILLQLEARDESRVAAGAMVLGDSLLLSS